MKQLTFICVVHSEGICKETVGKRGKILEFSRWAWKRAQHSLPPLHRVLHLLFVRVEYPSPNLLLFLIQTSVHTSPPREAFEPSSGRFLSPDPLLWSCCCHLPYISPPRNYISYLFESLFSLCFPNALHKHKVCCSESLACFIHCGCPPTLNNSRHPVDN